MIVDTYQPLARPELRTKEYDCFGDGYDDSMYNQIVKAKWAVEPNDDQSYLKLVKRASEKHWIHLRLLADFMQIGKIPRDWTNLKDAQPNDREERWRRANICILDYDNDGPPKGRKISSKKRGDLSVGTLKEELHIGPTEKPSFRLYVIEDLSRNVIETLGSEFKINPEVFRAHITDYAWYNVRDRWRDPQPLEVVRNQRNWFQLRYVTTRYYAAKDKRTEHEKRSGGCFEEAVNQAKKFNILRRPDDDKSRGWWDSEDAVVALTRSRATFWHRPKDSENGMGIGVLLLDPTVSEGLPLWRGHRNFHTVPSSWEDFQKDQSTWEPSTYKKPQSFFEDFIYWAQHPHVFSSSETTATDAPAEHLPMLTLLHLVGAEWLTMCDYIKTRLSQVDLETVDPVHFAIDQRVDVALGKLHMWRRFIPLYREMITETLQHVFHSPCCPGLMSTQGGVKSTIPGTSACPLHNSESQPGSTFQTSGRATPSSSRTAIHHEASTSGNRASTTPPSSIKAYKQDFQLVLTYLEEYQMRIDRLTSVVTAIMAVDDTRRAINDARNIGRLTWLATFFIPFSVVSGIFSMQELSAISRDTIRVYFATTLPVAVVTVAFAWALHSPTALVWLRRVWEIFCIGGKSEFGSGRFGFERSKEDSGMV